MNQSVTERAEVTSTRLYRSTPRYIQSPGLIDGAAEPVSQLKVRRCALLCSQRSQNNEARRLLTSLETAGIEVVVTTFGGECSLAEIEARCTELRAQPQAVDALIALGGGKTLDAGKSIADRLEVPVVIFPTLASNDAPCSAVSVIYSASGVTESYEVFAQNPSLVLVDSEIIAQAPPRFLVAGMGDAMSTWYEARACEHNPQALTPYGVRPTLAGIALSQVCAETLYQHGEAATEAVRDRCLSPALEHVIEANTLLSGLGFECAGLAAAHAVAQALTVLEEVDHNYLHGEMVALGVLVQLMLEQDHDEAQRAARFFARVGLPVNSAQLGFSHTDQAAMAAVISATLVFPFIGNMATTVTADNLTAAFAAVEALGAEVLQELGDQPYRRLHPNT
ncbi:glycerol dehydrogenase [Neptuniibacter halophilus]|uniref:glycerol dehydrogenase n=1 Tax=Neptuniibacter halophilus TaxID=651666 RepID=UPI002573532E|nr:glycerol dehydrogenase [Neptuniibacter halophilus]